MKTKQRFVYVLGSALCAALARRRRPRAGAGATASKPSTSAQQGGKIVVRITTKEPLRSVAAELRGHQPGAHRLRLSRTPSTRSAARARTSAQGELRSMNVVQGADRTRLVLNLRRAGRRTRRRSTGATWSSRWPSRRWRRRAPGGQVAHFAEGTRRDAKHAIRDVDFRRGRAGEGRVVVDLSDTTHRHRHPHAGPEHRRRVPQDRAAGQPAPAPRRGRFRHAGQHREHVPAGR